MLVAQYDLSCQRAIKHHSFFTLYKISCFKKSQENLCQKEHLAFICFHIMLQYFPMYQVLYFGGNEFAVYKYLQYGQF